MKTIQNSFDLEENMCLYNMAQYKVAKALNIKIKEVSRWINNRKIPKEFLLPLNELFKSKECDNIKNRIKTPPKQVPKLLTREIEMTSWVIKNKENNQAVFETFNRKLLDKLNTEKYIAVPIMQYLQSLNTGA